MGERGGKGGLGSVDGMRGSVRVLYLHHAALAAAPTFPSHDTVLYTVGYVVANRRTNFTCAQLFFAISLNKNEKRDESTVMLIFDS